MSECKDLTRWNRAGRTHFRYVDGKAAEYLEILRQQLVAQFADPETGLCEWLKPAEKIPANEEKVENETLFQRQERLNRKQERVLEMYHQDRRDWAWEITRTFARACHILTEHTNAYANEGYLGTATQWDHVRRLVEMLDYHPAPPASASTRLVLIAKENKKGIVSKGFQVKNNPTPPEAKVIFETLEDIVLDSALNELRPKGWDQSEDPTALSSDDNGNTQSPTEEQQSLSIVNGPSVNIQGVGPVSAGKLDTLVSTDGFKIKDFPDLDPDNSGLDIKATWLWEWKTKADILINFAPEGNWFAIAEWLLPDIAEESADALAELSGNSLEMARFLKQDIQEISMCLDHPVYLQTQLKDLVILVPRAGTVKTFWRAKRKPNVTPGQIAMIYREYRDEIEDKYVDGAEAATIAGIEKQTKIIHLTPSAVQTQKTWLDWSKSEARLKVSPRWKRECWLNGDKVIRTKEPHGLSAGAFVSWKTGGAWKFAKVIEVDKRNLRLELTGPLPGLDTDLFEANPITSKTMAADLEAIGMLVGELPAIIDLSFGESVSPEPPGIEKPFTINPPDYSTSDAASPPGGLSFGSFLFPTPMLPMDLVKVAVDLMLTMGVMVIPSTGEVVFKSLPDITMPNASDLLAVIKEIPNVEWAPGYDSDNSKIQALQSMLDNLPEPPPGDPKVQFKEILAELEKNNPLIAISKDPSVKAVVQASDPLYMFNGSSKIGVGDWVVGKFSDGLRALKVSTINWFTDSDKTETFSLSFEKLDGNKELKKVYADFRGELIAEGATVNNSEVDPEEIELEDVPESLKVGRDVLLMSEEKAPVAAKIESIVGNTITTNPPAIDFTKGDLIIRGNVVLAGHEEIKPAKILGSGNAAKSNQEFTLEVEQVSFTPDATKSSGVAAAIEVDVAGRVWEQVSTLKDSAPGDHHYAIRMTEEGYVKILFGDEENGRRLPTGKNNIRVRYRVGSGLAGNVPAGGLEKPVSPHPLIKAVLQPRQAAGGGDMEDMASLRENAPSTLLALERAVSLSDFSHLAAAQSSVWQAKAFSQILHGGKTESVKVVIVPADGIQSQDIKDDIEDFLQKHAMPGVQVLVDFFKEALFSLSVTMSVKTDEFIAEEVEKAVVSALVDHFTLKNRKLGEPLYLSEVYKVVESVRGVENSICVLNNDDTLQLIKAGDESIVVYLDTEADTKPSTLTVTHKEYQP